jgi:hypothetical protein
MITDAFSLVEVGIAFQAAGLLISGSRIRPGAHEGVYDVRG